MTQPRQPRLRYDHVRMLLAAKARQMLEGGRAQHEYAVYARDQHAEGLTRDRSHVIPTYHECFLYIVLYMSTYTT